MIQQLHHARTVERQIARTRRWLTLIACARLMTNGMFAGVSLALAVVVARALPLRGALPLVGTAATIGIVAGALLGLRRAPSARDAAAAIDRGLGLSDRAVTALECLRSDDAVSTLVVRDAASHLHDVSPRRLFPLTLPGATQRLAMAALLILIVATLRGREDVADPPRSGGLLVSLPHQSSSIPPGETERLRANAASNERDNARPTGGVPEPDRPRDAGSRQQATKSNTDPEVAAEQQPRSAPKTEAPDAGRGSVSATAAASNGATFSDVPAPALSPGRSSAGNGGSGRGGATPARGASGHAGGVSGEPAVAGRDRVVAAPIDQSDYRRDYASAAVRAEQAVATGSVPAHLRAYVRSYFTRIRPDQPR